MVGCLWCSEHYLHIYFRNIPTSFCSHQPSPMLINLCRRRLGGWISSVFGICLSVSVSIDIYSLHSQYRFLYYLPGTGVSLAWYWSVSMLGLECHLRSTG